MRGGRAAELAVLPVDFLGCRRERQRQAERHEQKADSDFSLSECRRLIDHDHPGNNNKGTEGEAGGQGLMQ